MSFFKKGGGVKNNQAVKPAGALPLEALPPEALPHGYRLVLEQFREWLLAKGMSRRTVEDYPDDLKAFLAFLFASGVAEPHEITPRHILSYQSFLLAKENRGKPLSLRTVNGRMGQVKTLFRFLLKTARIHHDPAALLELPKRPKTLPRGILEVKEVSVLLSAPDLKTPVGLRDRALLEMLYSTGLRSSEVRHLALSDLRLEEGWVFVKGKGGVEAYVPFGEETRRALENYLLFGRPHLFKGSRGAHRKDPRRIVEERGGELLFPTKNGHLMNCPNLWARVRYYAKKCGIEGNIGPHSFRHTCATHLLRGGADIRHIQALLRHKDVNTTQVYTRVCIDDLKEAQRKYHPRERKKSPEEEEAQRDGDEG